MSIAPVEKTVSVKATPERAFEAFTTKMGAWWPLASHSIGGGKSVAVVVEPRVDGRWYERAADGAEIEWGKVLAWEPPGRLLLAWQLNSGFAYDSSLITELELTFTDDGAGSTLVRLEHRNLERLGARAATVAASMADGWGQIIQQFVDYIQSFRGERQP